MEQQEFDAAETIAGFPLTSIKRALSWVGIMPDRDDIENVRKALKCPSRQAERVLETLEQRGFVAKTSKKRQWDTTELGRKLGLHWKPPRRMHPVIDREEEPGVINEGFGCVPCFIYRATRDDEASFEECDLDVGVFVEYETDKLIEISVLQPDYYDDRDQSCTVETSAYIGVDDAKTFSKALQAAIERAEKELARRAVAKPRRRPSPKERKPARVDTKQQRTSKPSSVRKEREIASSHPRTQSSTVLAKRKSEKAKGKPPKDMLAATLRELGHPR